MEAKKTAEPTVPEGRSFWASVVKVVFLLALGIGGFYTLGQMGDDIRGVQEEAQQGAQAPGDAMARPAPATNRTPPTRLDADIPVLPRMAEPPGSRLLSDSDTFLLNGSPRRIQTIAVDASSPTEVVNWYLERWHETQMEGTVQGDENFASATAMHVPANLRFTVVAKRDAQTPGTLVYASISSLKPIANRDQDATQIPLPPGSFPVMDMRSSDEGMPGDYVIYSSPLPLPETRKFLEERIPKLGWRAEETFNQASNANDAGMLYFTTQGRQLTLSLYKVDEKNTYIMVSETVDTQ